MLNKDTYFILSLLFIKWLQDKYNITSIVTVNYKLNKRYINPNELVYSTNIPKYITVFEPRYNNSSDYLINIIENNKNYFLSILNNGPILFRNFSIENDINFEDVIKSVGIKLSNEYRPGIAPRILKSNYSFTSSEAPKHIPILPHMEMAYTNIRPKYIAFYSLYDVLYMGETPIIDGVKVYKSLNKKYKKLFKYDTIIYRNFTDNNITWGGNIKKYDVGGSSWEKAFNSNNKSYIQDFCNNIGMNITWHDNKLITSINVPSTLKHQYTNEKSIQLQSPLYGKNTYEYMLKYLPSRFNNDNYISSMNKNDMIPPIYLKFSNGYKLMKNDIYYLMNKIWDNSIIFKWKKNDILLMDNIITAHSRLNVYKSNNFKRELHVIVGNIVDIRKM